MTDIAAHYHGWPLAASMEPPRDKGQRDLAPSCPLGQRDTTTQCVCATCFPMGKEAILDPELSGWHLRHLSASITVI